ncbi:hypothetical protein [Paludisphaera borealis]|uniref:Uncharacterized protein n=1 Tax=Paludisphaera borealis TaxID=1387353 RepID=A0A1U7CMK2_9BACT|nr:hypothetical protein [Paludisphaera borealis]APW60138.1 hypothetical protein BSF38_01602 [Paludisphaera borealis]
MKRFVSCFAAGILALAIVGCGDSGVTEGTVPFKATDTNTKQFEDMKKQMMANVKGPTPKKTASPAVKPAATAEPEKKN